jgi:primase-polymerase (primpol)-like protein
VSPAGTNEVLAVRPEGIPDELKTYRAWVLWRLVWIEEKQKWTKHPHSVHTGRKASSTDSRTWGSFENVLEAYEAGEYEGIGFVFSSGDPFAGVDLDKCRDPETGKVEPWAAELVETLDSYTELSPSGKGLHVIVKGKVPTPLKRPHVEMYSVERYFTVTGHVLDHAS